MPRIRASKTRVSYIPKEAHANKRSTIIVEMDDVKALTPQGFYHHTESMCAIELTPEEAVELSRALKYSLEHYLNSEHRG